MLVVANKVQDSHQHADSSTLHHSLGKAHQQAVLGERCWATRVAVLLVVEVALADFHSLGCLSCLQRCWTYAAVHQRACAESKK